MEQYEEGEDSELAEAVRGTDDVDRLIEQTEEAIRNTRSFLEHLRSSEQNAREIVDSMTKQLEKNLQYLRRKSEAEHP